MAISRKPEWRPTGKVSGAIPDHRRERELRQAAMPPAPAKPVKPPTLPLNGDKEAIEKINEAHQAALAYARRKNAKIKR